jgi:hypothetical protein
MDAVRKRKIESCKLDVSEGAEIIAEALEKMVRAIVFQILLECLEEEKKQQQQQQQQQQQDEQKEKIGESSVG